MTYGPVIPIVSPAVTGLAEALGGRTSGLRRRHADETAGLNLA